MAGGRFGWMAGRRGVVLAALTATVVVAAGAAAVVRNGAGPRTSDLVATGGDRATVESDGAGSPSAPSTVAPEPLAPEPAEASASTTTPPTAHVGATAGPPPPAPTPVAPGEAVTVATDPGGGWTLVRHDTAAGSCLELRVQTFRSERVLCNAKAAEPGRVLGEVITFNTPIGRALVGIVEPRIETWGASPYQQQHAPAYRDPAPERADYGYAAGVLRTMSGGNSSLQLFLAIGENVVARSALAVGDAAIPPGQSLTTTKAPYGLWPGYRRAGTTGFYWGGNEEFGFYDGGDGGRCVLYRRLGGDPEAMLFDVCAPRATSGIAAASFVPPAPPYATLDGWPSPMLVVVADGLQVVRWTCTTPAGKTCGATSPSPNGMFGRGAQLATDPAGSGRQLIGWFPDAMPDLEGAREVTVALYAAGDKQVARTTIPVP